MKKRFKAFTLIEILLAVFLFSLVLTIIFEIFLLSIRSQRKFLAEQELFDQVTYALEYMSKALRMAKKESSAPFCLSANGLNYENPGGDIQRIKFIDMENNCREFYLQNQKIMEGPLNLPLVSLKVHSLKFNLIGQDQGDGLQPRVTIFLEVEDRLGSKKQIQTTLSQRDLDVPE